MSSALLTLLIVGITGFSIIMLLTIVYHIKSKLDKRELKKIKTILQKYEE